MVTDHRTTPVTRRSGTRHATIVALVAATLTLASEGCSGCSGTQAPPTTADDAGRAGDATMTTPTDADTRDTPGDGAVADADVADAPVGDADPQSPGSLLLTVTTTLGAGRGCVPVVSGGAGVTATTIVIQTFEHQTLGVCVPAVLNRARDGIVTGTYTVDCVSPVQARCVEENETLSTSGLPPGAYQVRVVGLIQQSSCWIDKETVQVAGGAQVNQRVVLRNQQLPGCPTAPLAPPADPDAAPADDLDVAPRPDTWWWSPRGAPPTPGNANVRLTADQRVPQ